MPEPTSPDTAPPPATPTRPVLSWLQGNRLLLLLVGLLVFTVAVRWPIAKAMWYRVSGQAAPADTIPWKTDYLAALAESARTGRPVLLDFSASWCPPCQAMKHDVWPDPRVSSAVSQRFIPVALDSDAPDTRGPAARYAVGTIPRILIVNSSGTVLRDGQYMSADEMTTFLSLR